MGALAAMSAFIVYGLLLYVWFGDVTARVLLGAGFLRARLPELALLSGIAAFIAFGSLWLLIGAPVGALAYAAPAALLLLELASRARPAASGDGFENHFAPYLRFRSGWPGAAALLCVALFAFSVVVWRLPWVTHEVRGNQVALGTRLFDDLRTISFPVSLAAYGAPLHSPLAPSLRLAYPPGAFLFPASLIANFPGAILPIVAADCFLNALVYAIAALVAVSTAAAGLAMLPFLAVLVSLSVDFHLFGPDRNAEWYRALYGSLAPFGLTRTLVWTTYKGVMWLPNHALGLAAATWMWLLFTRWIKAQNRLSLVQLVFCSLIVVELASVSLDMTVMTIGAIGIAAGIGVLLHVRGNAIRWLPQVVLIGAVTSVALLLVNLPAVSGQVDAPVGASFVLIEKPWWNLGGTLSTHGLYLILLAALLLMGARLRGDLVWYAVPALTALVFSYTFRWQSIWFWRAALALHLLAALACAALLRSLTGSRRLAANVLWALLILAGAWNFRWEVKDEYVNVPRVPGSLGDIYSWVDHNTSIHDSVVLYDAAEGSLAPQVDLLRTGYRAGSKPFDRLLPVSGYRNYLDQMGSLLTGISKNDFVITRHEHDGVEKIIEYCRAPVAFENPAAAIYRIDGNCRQRLLTPEAAAVLRDYQSSRLELEKLHEDVKRLKDPLLLPDPQLQRLLILSTDESTLRRRVDAFWGANQWEEAVRFLEPIVAAHSTAMGEYCLAFTYQFKGRDLSRAILHYTRALDLGFEESYTRYGRGGSYLALGDREKGLADLRRAAEINPGLEGVKLLLKQ